MASKQQKKLEKRKEKERQTRKQTLARREKMRAPEREERQTRRKMKRIAKLQKSMGAMSAWADDVLLGLNDKALSQLEKNAQILKALEEEYQKTNAQREELNAKLEAEGLHTLEDKLNHLHNDLLRKQMQDSLKIEHSGCKFSSGEGEVAEVSVIKAPVSEDSSES